MPGRHQTAVNGRRRARLRWLAGLAGGAVVSSVVLATLAASAGASDDPVKATFSVTGVTTSNCNVSTGGTDVYVAPGQELDVKSSLAGLTVLGLPIDTSKIVSLDGSLTIDPGSANPTKLQITDTIQKVTGLTTGDHRWKWTVSSVKLLGGLVVPLHLSSSALSAGAQLTWTGTIHVTSNAAKCGIAVQLPSASASVSVSGLPPIAISIPGVKVSVPVDVPTSLPKPTGSGGGSSSGHSGGHSEPSAPDDSNPIPVPARVVPGVNGGGLLGGGGGYDAGTLPDTTSGGLGSGGAPSLAGAGESSAPQQPDQNSTGKHKTIDLAASRPNSTGEVWVVLAIVAVIALAFVAATYARLYLMKQDNS